MTGRAHPTFAHLARVLSAVVVLGGLTVTGAAAHVGLPLGSCAQASQEHHAALVVEHSDGSVIRICVPFASDSITGDQLLAYAKNVDPRHMEYDTGYSGQAVCQIDSEPTDESHCLQSGYDYWAMYVSRGGGAWTYASAGFTSQTFRDGDAEGFRFEGQDDRTTPPSPAGVCPVSTPRPSPVAASTPAPRRTASATAAASTAVPPMGQSSAAPSPSVAATPSASRTATPSPAVALPSSNQSAPLRPSGGGTLVAIALAAALVAILALQLVRARRRSTQRPPP